MPRRPAAPTWTTVAACIAATVGFVASQAAAQNPEFLERTCENLADRAAAEGWAERGDFLAMVAGDYDDPTRQTSPDWRLETICDGRFLWAYALFGDVAPFAFQPTKDQHRFVDHAGNEWVFTLDEAGAVTRLDWVTESNGTYALMPID